MTAEAPCYASLPSDFALKSQNGLTSIAAMSAAERQAYDEKKLKLRKAMAEADLSQELPADRQQNLEAAVTQDDWSSVVQEQIQETL